MIISSLSVFSQQSDSLKVKTSENENSTATDSEEKSESSSKFVPNLFFNVGLSNYRGDIGFISDIGSVYTAIPSYTLGVNYSFYNWIGVDLYGTYFGLTQSERTLARNHNFKTTVFGGGLNLKLLLANDVIIPLSSGVQPYLIGGLSFYSFNQKTDLKSSDGEFYNYWSDGSIRDLPESEINALTANEITRDLDYETDIENVGSSSLGFSYGLGSYFRVNSWVNVQADFTYTSLMSDAIDGLEVGKWNDGFFNFSLGANFNLHNFKNKKTKQDNFYANVNFDAILAADSDADGVKDIDDRCLDTPQDIKVDLKGCPIDTDKDGVPDYKDEEIESAKDATVDENGKAIPDSLVKNASEDTLVTLRSQLCEFYPSMCNFSDSDVQYQILNTGSADNIKISSENDMPIEEIVKLADNNKNGKIDVKEIYDSIDLFLTGESKMQMNDVHRLVDYFFSQSK